MSSFKDIANNDIVNTFFNLDEFSDTHTINGVEMSVQVDSNELIEREKKMSSKVEGAYLAQKLIYVAADDFGALPAVGSKIRFDKVDYRIVGAINEGGVYSITMERVKGL